MDTNYQDLPSLIATPSSDTNLPSLLAQSSLLFGESSTSPVPATTLRTNEDVVDGNPVDATGTQAFNEGLSGDSPALDENLPSSAGSSSMESNPESLSADTRTAENREGDSPSRSLAGLILLRYSNLTADRVESLIANVRRGMENSQPNTIHLHNLSTMSTSQPTGTTLSPLPQPPIYGRPRSEDTEGSRTVEYPQPQRATDRATLLAQATTSRGRRVLERVRNASSESNPPQESPALVRLGASTYAQNRASSSALLAHLERQHGSISPRPRLSDEHTHQEYMALDRLVARLRRSREYAARNPLRERGLGEDPYTLDNPLRYSDLSDLDQPSPATNAPSTYSPETRRIGRTFTFSEGRLSRSEPDLGENRALSDDGTRSSQTSIRRRINDAGLSLPVHRSAGGIFEYQPSAEPEARGVRVRLRMRGQDSQSNEQYLSFANPAPGEPQSSAPFPNLNLPRQIVQNGRSRTRGWARVDPNGDDILTDDEGEHPRSDSLTHRENGNEPYSSYQDVYESSFDYWNDKPADHSVHPWSDSAERSSPPSRVSGSLTSVAEFSPSPLPTKLSEMIVVSDPSTQNALHRHSDRLVPRRAGQLVGR